MSEGPNLLTNPTRIAKGSIYAHIRIPGEPLSKQRPRFVRKNGSVFTPRETRVAEDTVGWHVRAGCRVLMPNDQHIFGLRVAFYYKRRTRKDLDNMVKLVMDGISDVAWKDDSQVHEIMAWKIEQQRGDPQTELLVYTIGSLRTHPTRHCEACGKQFRIYPSWEAKRHCSRACQVAATRSGQGIPCAQCGKSTYRAPHRVKRARNTFCSDDCRQQFGSVEIACSTCGESFRKPRSWVRANNYCTPECSAEGHRTRQRERYRKIHVEGNQ
jgi:Holliday junction resolvase RusA-like endonuclease